MPQDSILTGSLYDYPRYYDLVFGSDWKAEFDFLVECMRRFTVGKVRSVFEPACGTGRLLYRLAKAGWNVAGLDLNPHAVEFCNQRLKRSGYRPSVEVADMTDFRLRKPVCFAFNTINSFRHLLSEKLAKAHLACMANSVRSGGVYVLGFHLTPTSVPPVDEESWSARRGHLCVNTQMKTVERDSKSRVERCSLEVDVFTPTTKQRLSEVMTFRMYSLSQWRKLIGAVPEWDWVESYDFSYNLDEPIEPDSATEDIVCILRRK